jgi:hypothetical protein
VGAGILADEQGAHRFGEKHVVGVGNEFRIGGIAQRIGLDRAAEFQIFRVPDDSFVSAT